MEIIRVFIREAANMNTVLLTGHETILRWLSLTQSIIYRCEAKLNEDSKSEVQRGRGAESLKRLL